MNHERRHGPYRFRGHVREPELLREGLVLLVMRLACLGGALAAGYGIGTALGMVLSWLF